jgi:tRNA threonylcarbamoyladenosine biosynthesis protein TsaE
MGERLMITESVICFPTEASLLSFGEKLAHAVVAPAIIFMNGPLGAGKTTLARGFLHGLGYKAHVKSPTYTLVEPYPLKKITVFHFDLYRLHDPHELEFMGIQDYFNDQAICLIEWPEKGVGVLPEADLLFDIEMYKDGRKIKCTALSDHGSTILHRMAYE